MRPRQFPANDREGWLAALIVLGIGSVGFLPDHDSNGAGTALPPLRTLTIGAADLSSPSGGPVFSSDRLPVAQRTEQLPSKERAVGSTPTGQAKPWRRAELSWYDGYRLTASGERFDRSSRTVAVMYRPGSNKPRLPFGTVVEFRTVSPGGRVLSVSRARVNNTGSYRPRRSDWWFDGTPAVFRSHAPLKRGRLIVEWRVVR